MKEISPEEREKLTGERTELLTQAEFFLEKEDYELLSETFTQIAEISLKLGDEELANDLKKRAEKINTLLMAQEAPPELEEPVESSPEGTASPQLAPQQAIPSEKPQSLIDEKRKKYGAPLESGIIPTVIKPPEDVLGEILDERLPYLPEKEREETIQYLLKYPAGSKRDTFLKVFLIKYKKYGTSDPPIIQNKIDEKITWFIENSTKDLKGTIGLFDPFQIIETMTNDEIKYLLNTFNMTVDSDLKELLLLKLYEQIQKSYNYYETIREKFSNPIQFLGNLLYSDSTLLDYFKQFDIISKWEMIEIFADYCADEQIPVQDLTIEREFPWDLCLIKDVNKHAAAIFLPGHEVVEKLDEAVKNLTKSTEYCHWNYFITTPFGVLNVGLDKLIKTMEEVGAWVYIIDPFHSVIHELLKGSDSSKRIKEKEQQLIDILKNPLRHLNPQKPYSKYEFDNKFQKKAKYYKIFSENIYPPKTVELKISEKDEKNLQYLLFLHKRKGFNLNFIKWTTASKDPDLISGLISALDDFGSSIDESKGLQELQYGGFTVTFTEGKDIKACLFLKETPSPRLKELLKYSLQNYESLFENEIKNFSGALRPFTERQPELENLLNQIFQLKK